MTLQTKVTLGSMLMAIVIVILVSGVDVGSFMEFELQATFERAAGIKDVAKELVIDALNMAWFRRSPNSKTTPKTELIFHSDRGSQYASYEFNSVLKECGITPSMSGKGNCWDNACSETLFGSLKVERLHGEHFETLRQAKDETLDWLLWYNQTRLHSTLNYVSPTQFEQNWNRSTATITS